MKIKRISLALPIFLLFITCTNKSKKLTDLFNQSIYDKEVIQKLPQYTALKNIVIKNIDAIFDFRNSRNVIEYHEKNKITRKHEDEKQYDFYCKYGGQEIVNDINKNMPDFILLPINVILKEIGRDYILGFSLRTDSSLEIIVRNMHDDETHSDIGHRLKWTNNPLGMKGSFNLGRDTMIAPGWNYSIWVYERPGW